MLLHLPFPMSQRILLPSHEPGDMSQTVKHEWNEWTMDQSSEKNPVKEGEESSGEDDSKEESSDEERGDGDSKEESSDEGSGDSSGEDESSSGSSSGSGSDGSRNEEADDGEPLGDNPHSESEDYEWLGDDVLISDLESSNNVERNQSFDLFGSDDSGSARIEEAGDGEENMRDDWSSDWKSMLLRT